MIEISPHPKLRAKIVAALNLTPLVPPQADTETLNVVDDAWSALSDLMRLVEQKEATDAALGKIALMQSGALAIIRDNGFVFKDIGKEPGNWQHLAFTLYNLICEIDVEARHALGIEIGEALNPAISPSEDPAGYIVLDAHGMCPHDYAKGLGCHVCDPASSQEEGLP